MTQQITTTLYLLRYWDLKSRNIVTNRMTLSRWMRRARDPFPATLRLGPNTVAWRVADVEAWLARLAQP